MNTKSQQNKLKRLTASQEKDRQSRYAFPERITPRNPILFPNLTPSQKVCFILSFFMPRREIAKVLGVRSETVTKYRKRGYKRLLLEERLNLRKLRRSFHAGDM